MASSHHNMQNMPNQTLCLIWHVLQHTLKGYLHLFDLLELNQHHFRVNHYRIAIKKEKLERIMCYFYHLYFLLLRL